MVISDDNAICLKSEKNEHGTSWKFSYIQLVPESVATGCQWKIVQFLLWERLYSVNIPRTVQCMQLEVELHNCLLFVDFYLRKLVWVIVNLPVSWNTTLVCTH